MIKISDLKEGDVVFSSIINDYYNNKYYEYCVQCVDYDKSVIKLECLNYQKSYNYPFEDVVEEDLFRTKKEAIINTLKFNISDI